jgi:glycerol-3-phosphate dehydrogenase
MTRDVARLSGRTFDLLVIGGGIYGLTIAADAAQRGLSVALVERDDFGSGNSFNHLRTIHGGLRYLQTLDLSRARESIVERRVLARIAPSFVRPLPFVLPLTRRLMKGPAMMRAGFLLDALVARDRNDGVPESHRLPPGQVIGAADARARFPWLRDTRMQGAALWHDYVVTESDRLTLAWALAATSHGATLVNHVSATRLLREDRRVVGAQVTDDITGDRRGVSARVVVNATGGDLDALLDVDGMQTGTPMLRAMNLVTRLEGGTAAIGAQAASGRALFMVPWRGRALFGTWESSGLCRGAERTPSDAEVAAFVAEVAGAFPGCGLSRKDVTLVHRGVVPAAVDDRGRVWLEGRQRLIDHATGPSPVEGLISVAGTKYTTARAAAQTVVDRVLTKLSRASVPCRTSTLPLPATANPSPRAPRGGAAVGSGLAPEVLAHLEAAYGGAHESVLTLAEGRADLAERLSDAAPVIGAQLAWAARHEMAVTLADAVLRRTPLGALGHPGAAALARAGRIMALELNWSEDRLAGERQAIEEFYR